MRAINPYSMVAGLYYYDGDCAPITGGHSDIATFSVGIFKAHLTAKGDRCKRGPVLYRVKGKIKDADKVFARADRICRIMNQGLWVSTKKSETVK